MYIDYGARLARGLVCCGLFGFVSVSQTMQHHISYHTPRPLALFCFPRCFRFRRTALAQICCSLSTCHCSFDTSLTTSLPTSLTTSLTTSLGEGTRGSYLDEVLKPVYTVPCPCPCDGGREAAEV